MKSIPFLFYIRLLLFEPTKIFVVENTHLRWNVTIKVLRKEFSRFALLCWTMWVEFLIRHSIHLISVCIHATAPLLYTHTVIGASTIHNVYLFCRWLDKNASFSSLLWLNKLHELISIRLSTFVYMWSDQNIIL